MKSYLLPFQLLLIENLFYLNYFSNIYSIKIIYFFQKNHLVLYFNRYNFKYLSAYFIIPIVNFKLFRIFYFCFPNIFHIDLNHFICLFHLRNFISIYYFYYLLRLFKSITNFMNYNVINYFLHLKYFIFMNLYLTLLIFIFL